jgi:hypothetical protein
MIENHYKNGEMASSGGPFRFSDLAQMPNSGSYLPREAVGFSRQTHRLSVNSIAHASEVAPAGAGAPARLALVSGSCVVRLRHA